MPRLGLNAAPVEVVGHKEAGLRAVPRQPCSQSLEHASGRVFLRNQLWLLPWQQRGAIKYVDFRPPVVSTGTGQRRPQKNGPNGLIGAQSGTIQWPLIGPEQRASTVKFVVPYGQLTLKITKC